MQADTLTSQQAIFMHAQIDQDGDGHASLAEVMGFSREMRGAIAKMDIRFIMKEMDLDRDGRLTLEEVLKDMQQWAEEDPSARREDASWRQRVEAAKFLAADVNGDGFLSLGELPPLFYPETRDSVLDITVAAAFEQKDLDGDGFLTEAEFWEGGLDMDEEEVPTTAEEHSDFSRLDADGDGRLNVDELSAWESGHYHTLEAMRKLFAVADSDRDAHLTAAELDAARLKLAGSDAQYILMEWLEHREL